MESDHGEELPLKEEITEFTATHEQGEGGCVCVCVCVYPHTECFLISMTLNFFLVIDSHFLEAPRTWTGRKSSSSELGIKD